jgi:hypothetical protein
MRDPNGDALVFTIDALPAAGALFQYEGGARGAPIVAAGTQVSDSQGRVVFVPAPGGSAVAYAQFTVTASDGAARSGSVTVTVDVLPEPVLTGGGTGVGGGPPFRLRFEGLPGASYSVWSSLDLRRWTRLGTAVPVEGGFEYIDTQSVGISKRYYRLESP